MRKIILSALVAVASTILISTSFALDGFQQRKSQIMRLVTDIDQRAVLLDHDGKAYQIWVEGKEVRLFEAGSSGEPVGIIEFDRNIDGLKDASSFPGWQYLPSNEDAILCWFVQDGKTFLLSFRLRSGHFQSSVIEIDGYIYPVAYDDGSIGGMWGNPWRVSFDVARVTETGLARSSGSSFEPAGAPNYVIGSIIEEMKQPHIRTTAFSNWSNVKTQYITVLSSNGEKHVYNHDNNYAPLALLSSNELLMLDVTGCVSSGEESPRERAVCSSSIVSVPIPPQDGAIDFARKRLIRKFDAPEILLQTTSPSSLRDSTSLALVGDRLFTVSRTGKMPHLSWVSLSDPSQTGQIKLGERAGDDIVIAMNDRRSGRLIVTLDGFLSPLRYFGVAAPRGDKAARPHVETSVQVRFPTFRSTPFGITQIDNKATGSVSLMVTRRDSNRPAACHGRALIKVYGGYGSPTHADYLTSYGPFWLAKGNSYVAAHVRGGGDLGEAAYRQGTGLNFVSSVSDLIAVARELRKRGCIDVTVMGNSHGGNLAALAALAAPRDINRAIINASPLDLEQGLKDQTFNTNIYPSFNNDADKEKFLATASPLAALNLFTAKQGKPAFLLFYGDKDNVVQKLHGERFSQAAINKGLEAKMVVYPDLEHDSPFSVADYADQMSRILAFIDGDP
jgi:alpha-beta hydrolase superfamily lysophospholipase